MLRSSILDLRSADLYLDRINPEQETATFRRVAQAELQSTIFLDHREAFGTGEPTVVPIAEMIAMAGQMEAAPVRLLLHMAFCGSTLLSRLLDESGAALVLKEPHALVDLADWDRTLRALGRSSSTFDRALDNSLKLLFRPWPGGLPTVIKPSNWANLPLLRREPRSAEDRVLLMTIDPRSFLRAAFRGGRDRLAFLARAAGHFAAARGQSPIVAAAMNDDIDALGQAARLVLTAHESQRRSFDAFVRTAPAGMAISIDYCELRDSPELIVARAAEHFGLAVDENHLSSAVRRCCEIDAKLPGTAFSLDRQDEADDHIERLHGHRFDQALSWSMASFGPEIDDTQRRASLSRA